jgi:hypothetical protein
MKRTLFAIALSAACLSGQAATFNYHGNLQDAGKPANGRYDIELTLYSAADGGKAIAGPLTLYKVDVHEGAFNAEAPFASLQNVPQQAWLGVRVRATGESEFAALGARASVGADAVTSSVCPGAWTLNGNAGNPSGSYIGTADASNLVFKINALQVAMAYFNSGSSLPNWIGGGSYNNGSGGDGSFVGGGGSSTVVANRNLVGPFSAIVGGDANQAGIGATNGRAFVGGGTGNKANSDYATIAGGSGNTARSAGATVGGGMGNTAGPDPVYGGPQTSTVAGGYMNTALWGAAVGGGYNNIAHGQASVIGGGNNNRAYDYTSAVVGGEGNVAYSGFDVVLGGTDNLAGGGQSLAAGSGARVRISGPVPSTLPDGVMASDYTGSNSIDDGGTFMWADTTAAQASAPFNSNGANKFLVLATGGVDFVTGRNLSTLAWTSGAHLAAGGGSWSSISDRNLKTDFSDIDAESVLENIIALPISTWRYKAQDAAIRHIGPMAQDFYAAFKVGEDERHITQVDEGGVALAAIQGLNKKLEAENAQLRQQLAALATRLSALEHDKEN